MIVQKKKILICFKIVIKYTLEDISLIILYKAFNGYSVVFSDAISKTIIPKLFNYNVFRTDFTFIKVGNLDTLIKIEKKNGVINVFC
jgi:hypothetical protein